jgi:asparagine synthase (glutamine-hydrolysing)
VTSTLRDALTEWWAQALRRTADDRQPLSVLYSGGLDSSLVATGLQAFAPLELVTVGARDSADIAAAERGARILQLPWKGRVIDLDDVRRTLHTVAAELNRASPASTPVLLGLALALETASNVRVVCGQGADELFLGYAHFDGLATADAAGLRRMDLDKLLQEDWPLSRSIAGHYGKSLHSPFLEAEFLEHVQMLSIDQLRSGPGRKPLLRQLATDVGLPAELAERRKKAFQYGSGTARLLRRVRQGGDRPSSRE